MQNNDYISREAAIKAITELMSSPWATEGTHSIGIKEALSLVRDMIRGNVPKGMQIPDADVRPVVRWIPVEERLPEQDVFVIGAVYHTDLIIAEYGESTEEACARCQAEAAKHPRVELCFYGEDGWYSCDGFPMVCTPSCWMEMPEAPEIGDLQ